MFLVWIAFVCFPMEPWLYAMILLDDVRLIDDKVLEDRHVWKRIDPAHSCVRIDVMGT